MKNTKYVLIALIGSFLSLISVSTVNCWFSDDLAAAQAALNQFSQNNSERQKNDGVNSQGNTILHDYAQLCYHPNLRFDRSMMTKAITHKNIETKNKEGKTPRDILEQQIQKNNYRLFDSLFGVKNDCEFLRNSIDSYLQGRSDASPEQVTQEIQKLLK